MIPVYLINGFLESGKTEFIAFTLAQPYFKSKGKTLLLVCEEGETDYDAGLLKQAKTFMEIIEDEDDFNPVKLMELEQKYRPERIIIEYNGMWSMKDMVLPEHWSVEQQITNIDARSFPMYYTNMKSMVAEMVRNSELIIFNRCDGIKELSSYKRNVKAVNQRAEIIFEDANGEINEMMEEELPYDIHQPIIELDDMGFGIWYLDSLDHLERYEEKSIKFLAQVLKPKTFPKDYFVPGRLAMTCCAEDMAFLGFACEYEKTEELKEKSWVWVTARVAREYWPDYEGEGPVLHAIKVEEAKEPEDPIISFT
ncbi:MAG: GTP-binding protein [Lachnospiraceae bacterium]|nr:GTP-binding protein [Lachnospiraceae bacterium]MDY5699484.1 GTP-binding protein [Lachnospiraceae bacterium]